MGRLEVGRVGRFKVIKLGLHIEGCVERLENRIRDLEDEVRLIKADISRTPVTGVINQTTKSDQQIKEAIENLCRSASYSGFHVEKIQKNKYAYVCFDK